MLGTLPHHKGKPAANGLLSVCKWGHTGAIKHKEVALLAGAVLAWLANARVRPLRWQSWRMR